ncbi:hypothetical protein [Brevundimonas naejangsanensis]|uniref:hypothetical protein n=1 Tax=Brevundimonas naejangsanensis TaxID=588932 RepID=UPI0013C40640|nr:hypothetical protein [Brevundimonas naejangsanensis]
MTLLAVSFAFGLATLGAALAVSARSYLVSAASRERAILDRISLESVAAQTLADIAIKRERPSQALQLEPVLINGRLIMVEASIPEIKVDLAMDDDEVIRSAMGGTKDHGEVFKGISGMAAWASAAGLSTVEEDCIRRVATFGRAPETFAASLRLPEAPLNVRLERGDQVDVRAILKKGRADQVLWVRARFDNPQVAWRVHDYRKLDGKLSRQCRLDAAPKGLGQRQD